MPRSTTAQKQLILLKSCFQPGAGQGKRWWHKHCSSSTAREASVHAAPHDLMCVHSSDEGGAPGNSAGLLQPHLHYLFCHPEYSTQMQHSHICSKAHCHKSLSSSRTSYRSWPDNQAGAKVTTTREICQAGAMGSCWMNSVMKCTLHRTIPALICESCLSPVQY